MDLPLFLDITIALFFIYLSLSLLVSEIQEIIASSLQLHARSLRQAIIILLAENALPKAGTSNDNTNKTTTNQNLEILLQEIEQAEMNLRTVEGNFDPQKKEQAIVKLNSLSGEVAEVSVEAANQLTDKLYKNSLIRSLNQTTLGKLTKSRFFRPSQYAF